MRITVLTPAGNIRTEIDMKTTPQMAGSSELKAQKELDQQNADGAASARDKIQLSPTSKTNVGSQR
jgi:hypothetical protein